MASRDYSAETKAAVMAALLAGQSVSSVARDYAIPKGTVAGWKRQAVGTAQSAVSAEQSAEIGDLLLSYLRTTLHALRVQAEHFADPVWLAKQDASQLAVLHGVAVDKAIRLLEAMNTTVQPDG